MTSDWFVIYKGGPDTSSKQTKVLRGLHEQAAWMRKDLAKKSGMVSYEMGGLLSGLVKKGEVIKHKRWKA